MSKHESDNMKCAKCHTPIPNRSDRQTHLCRKCVSSNRCQNCGQILGRQEHRCASVDLKGPRYCRECGKKLSNHGYERWVNRCPQCTKKRWRAKERKQRQTLVTQFGGKCNRCSYDRCLDALHFHHADPSEKYDWNVKGQTGASSREIKMHPERFLLLCANCHIELHAEQRRRQRAK